MGVLLGAFALTGVAVGAPAESNRASCDNAALGEGPDNWRELAITAGPVSVFKRPLSRMTRTANGLVTKMPMLIHGERPLSVSVPPRLRGRVFLYYGRVIGRDGEPTTTLSAARGYEETRFEPCSGRARTPFPGGIRVRGGDPVTLTIRVEGEPRTHRLRLGAPRAYSTPKD